MEKFKLKLEDRAEMKPNALRRDGKIPATVYGPGVASVNAQLSQHEFVRLPAAAYSHIIELQSPKGPVSAIIRHVQRTHTTNEVLNVEFYRVASDRRLTVTVPLKYVGASEAVRAGGHFTENFTAAEVECLPADIPDYIEVDISAITEIDQGIHFSEVKVPDSIKILNPAEEVVCKVVAIKAEKTKKEDAAAPKAAAAPAAAAAAPKAAAKA